MNWLFLVPSSYGVPLRDQSRLRKDGAGTGARTLAREPGARRTLVGEAGVEPTNKRAAGARRCAVRWRRMLPGTDTEPGARWGERLRSGREPCRRRGIPTFPRWAAAVRGAVNGRHPDVSWISRLCPPEPLQVFLPLLHCRGRDAGHPALPAQIRTCGTTAYGSDLGCMASKRTLSNGCRMHWVGIQRWISALNRR